MSKSFGEQLREERKKKRMTTKTIAAACNISRSYITLMENGRRLPGKKLLPKIADALHLKPAVVLNWYLEHLSQKMQHDLKVS